MSRPGENERLARLEERLDQTLKQRADHEDRIRTLERVRWTAIGFAAAGGGIASAAVALLTR